MAIKMQKIEWESDTPGVWKLKTKGWLAVIGTRTTEGHKVFHWVVGATGGKEMITAGSVIQEEGNSRDLRGAKRQARAAFNRVRKED